MELVFCPGVPCPFSRVTHARIHDLFLVCLITDGVSEVLLFLGINVMILNTEFAANLVWNFLCSNVSDLILWNYRMQLATTYMLLRLQRTYWNVLIYRIFANCEYHLLCSKTVIIYPFCRKWKEEEHVRACVCVCVCINSERGGREGGRKVSLIQFIRDQTDAELSNIPGLSEGTYAQPKFLRVIICYCSCPWVAQRIRGVVHLDISFIGWFRIIMAVFYIFLSWWSRRQRARKCYNGWSTYNSGVLFEYVSVIFMLHSWSFRKMWGISWLASEGGPCSFEL